MHDPHSNRMFRRSPQRGHMPRLSTSASAFLSRSTSAISSRNAAPAGFIDFACHMARMTSKRSASIVACLSVLPRQVPLGGAQDQEPGALPVRMYPAIKLRPLNLQADQTQVLAAGVGHASSPLIFRVASAQPAAPRCCMGRNASGAFCIPSGPALDQSCGRPSATRHPRSAGPDRPDAMPSRLPSLHPPELRLVRVVALALDGRGIAFAAGPGIGPRLTQTGHVRR